MEKPLFRRIQSAVLGAPDVITCSNLSSFQFLTGLPRQSYTFTAILVHLNTARTHVYLSVLPSYSQE